LQLMSEATFPEGIVKGVPAGQRVAHKFGYAVIDGESQLHDCGIVYHPKMAYVLCVMTTSADTNKANDAIVDIAKTVYDAVSGLDFSKMQKESF
jgi:beta-lactamase class A